MKGHCRIIPDDSGADFLLNESLAAVKKSQVSMLEKNPFKCLYSNKQNNIC